MTFYKPPVPIAVSTTAARDKLSEIIRLVQDPRSYCVLTRHGKSVAAIVSMAELLRIADQQDIDDTVKGKRRPMKMIYGTGDHATPREAAEAIQKVQMDRWMEREVLLKAGLTPVPGGELRVEMASSKETSEGWLRRLWPFKLGVCPPTSSAKGSDEPDNSAQQNDPRA